MKNIFTGNTTRALRLAVLATFLGAAAAVRAQSYQFTVVASGLHRPTGIAVRGNHTIYFSELPTPGVNGARGGSNSVNELNLKKATITTLHMGEPEPVNLSFSEGSLYWTCKSAGVILEQDKRGVTSVFLSGLNKPNDSRSVCWLNRSFSMKLIAEPTKRQFDIGIANRLVLRNVSLKNTTN